MIVAAVAIVAWPYYAQTREFDASFVADPVLEDLIVQRDATYAAIKDLEFDHAIGKLSDADYKSLRAKYETKAVAILQELDGLQAAQVKRASLLTDDEMLEREVQRLRRGASSGSSSNCPKCGSAYAAGDAFCAKCGASLRGVRCPACGTRAAIGDKFCARCGTQVASPATLGG
jgi:rRNA maturation endonuclease Nob1